MKIGDLVRHKGGGLIGVVYKVWMNYCFVQWADGNREHSIRIYDLEVINEDR